MPTLTINTVWKL